jgi:hypothetical protein
MAAKINCLSSCIVPIDHDYQDRACGANICFKCKNACGGCSWSEIDPNTKHPRFKPVKGWTAKKTKSGDLATYKITACPKFEEG